MELSNRWYNEFRKLRGDIALITAMYQFSEIDKLPVDQIGWKAKTLANFESLVLRMKGPRKPTKKKFTMKDLDYDVGNAFLECSEALTRYTMDISSTLHEFVTKTKGIEYVIAVLFLVLFPMFWRLLKKTE